MVASADPEWIQGTLPKYRQLGYFTSPNLQQLAARELQEPGYCGRVNDFVVGRKGYGSVKFIGQTDVRGLELDDIVLFGHQEVIVYSDEQAKPPVGTGLNKPAEVTLQNIFCKNKLTGEIICDGPELQIFEERLKRKTKDQGAHFVSYSSSEHEWVFQVEHFSRFGLDDESDEEEPAQGNNQKAVVAMDEEMMLQDAEGLNNERNAEKLAGWQNDRSDDGSDEIRAGGSPMQDVHFSTPQSALAHSLPQHLRLDPLKMQQMKMLFFSSGEEMENNVHFTKVTDNASFHPATPFHPTTPFHSASKAPFPSATPFHSATKSPFQSSMKSPFQSSMKSPFQSSIKSRNQALSENAMSQGSPAWKRDQPSPNEESPRSMTFSKHIMKVSPQASWKRPSLSPLGRHPSLEIENEASPMKQSRMLLSLEGKNEQAALKQSTTGFKNDITPASCMFGRSSNVIDAALFLGCSFRVGWGPHGLLVHSGNPVGVQGNTVSSTIHLEKVALDGSVRDEEGKTRHDLIDLQFLSPLNVHMSMSRLVDGMDEQISKIRLRYVCCDRKQLPTVCNQYEGLLVKQHALDGLSAPHRLVLRHQVMAWHLLSVLFSEKSTSQEAGNEDEDLDDLDNPQIDPEVAALVRRAEFSNWLQDSVRHIIQDELMELEANDQLKELFALLTGRQLDEGVQLAVTRGDVRLACLVSQAGGSMITRRDIAHQLEIWLEEGLDFSLIERDMILLYKLLSGDIQGALEGRNIDWKRFLGLLMWYHLAPDTQLPDIIRTYSVLVEEDVAPQPVPMYVEEGASHGISLINRQGLYDTAYFLMLLHANEGQNVDVSKMFSSSSSTYDPLDHRMSWLQHGVLEAIDVLAPIQLHVLDMSFVSQLLSIGECHWAVYVALHMPPNLEYPGLHEKVIKEILNQYCEVWSTNEAQQTFLEKELGIPSEWLHEALGTYWQYRGDQHKAVKHLLKSMQWHRAHTLLMTSVAASLFIAGQYEELLEILTPLERNKMELDDWSVSGGMYADFFVLKNSFKSDDFTEELGSFESKVSACNVFFQRVKESQVVWENRWSAENRVAYSRMASELSTLILTESKVDLLNEEAADLNVYNSVMDAPVPEDARFYHLQGAASAFTSWLVQSVPQ